MRLNTVTLSPGGTFEEVEMVVGELCAMVKGIYGGGKGGFSPGQVFKFSGFISNKGSLSASGTADNHYVIVIYWRSFDDFDQPCLRNIGLQDTTPNTPTIYLRYLDSPQRTA